MNNCGTCYYFWWNGQPKWCRHPKNNREIRDHTKKCKLWIQDDAKQAVEIPRIPLDELPKEAP